MQRPMRRNALAKVISDLLINVTFAQEGSAAYSRTCWEIYDQAPRLELR